MRTRLMKSLQSHKRPMAVRAALVAVLASCLAGCGPGGPIAVRLHEQVTRPQRSAVLFIVDGASVDLINIGCTEGWLPNIRDRLVKRGTSVDHAITAVPSITYAVLSTFATGTFPSTHQVLGNEWFDPSLCLYRGYGVIKHYRAVNAECRAPTIYERIQPRVSLSIQSPMHRGVTRNIANWAQSGVRWYLRDYTAVDKLTATTLTNAARWANSNCVWPDLSVFYFPGVDTVGHRFGVGSDRYRRALEHFDYQFGRICDWLESERLLDSTVLALVSDHGLVSVAKGGEIDLARYVRDELGRRVTDRFCQDGSFESRYWHFRAYDAVVVPSAVRFASIYFRGELGWDDPLEPDELREILEIPPVERRLRNHDGIDLLAFSTGEREAEIRSPRGTARVIERDGPAGVEYRYVPQPDDVLEYMDDPALAAFVEAGFHSAREWLDATCEQRFPDIVPHLVPLLRSPRAGDVVLFAAPGYSFGEERSGHGGINRVDMRIPMFFAGPGIEPGGHIDVAHAADLAPTLMALLGCEPAADDAFDGVALFPVPRIARNGAP